MSNFTNSVVLIICAAVVTLVLRAIPFMVFSGDKKMPEGVKRIVDLFPATIMAVLVVYCIKIDLYGIKEILCKQGGNMVNIISTLIALASVTAVHLWKRNTLISIAVGTVVYMVLIRLIPFIV